MPTKTEQKQVLRLKIHKLLESEKLGCMRIDLTNALHNLRLEDLHVLHTVIDLRLRKLEPTPHPDDSLLHGFKDSEWHDILTKRLVPAVKARRERSSESLKDAVAAAHAARLQLNSNSFRVELFTKWPHLATEDIIRQWPYQINSLTPQSTSPLSSPKESSTASSHELLSEELSG